MQIQRTKDKIVITESELQTLLRDAIRAKVGREVSGQVNFQKSGSSDQGDNYTAWCRLEDATKY